MVSIIKNGNNIKIDEIEISIKDYNDRNGWYKSDEIAIKNEYKKLADEIYIGNSKLKPGKTSSDDDPYYSTEEYLKELEKVKKVNYSLYNEVEKLIKEKVWKAENKSFHSLYESDDETRTKKNIDHNNERVKALLDAYNELLPKLRQVFTQKEKTGNDWGNDYNDPNKDKSREELGQRANEIEAYRKKVKGEIEAEMNNKLIKITKEELESGNQGWENEIWSTIIALGEKEIDDIKTRVLADISAKRAVKQGKKQEEPITGQELKNFARDAVFQIDTERNKDEGTDLFVTHEELEKNNPDWRKKIMAAAEAGKENEVKHIKVKVLVDLRFRKAQKEKDKEDKNQAASLTKSIADAVNSNVNELSDEELTELMKLFQRWEGDKKVEELRNKNKSVEEKLIDNNPDLYKQTVINALWGRIKDYNINPDDLSEETRQLVSGEIIQVSEIKEIKDKAIREIGEVGAKGKWNSLFSQAKSILAKAKEKATEKVKSDIKEIQKQMKNFKSDANTYLSSFYQQNKSEVEKWEKSLSDYSANQTNEPKETPWGVIIPVSLVVVALIGVAAVVIVRRRKQAK